MLERHVITAVLNELTPERIEQIADLTMLSVEEKKSASKIPALEAEIRETEKKINGIVTAIENGSTSPALISRLEDLEILLDKQRDQLAAEKDKIIPVTRELVVWWLNQFKEGSIEDPVYCRNLIDYLVETVTVTDTDLVIKMRISEQTIACSDNPSLVEMRGIEPLTS